MVLTRAVFIFIQPFAVVLILLFNPHAEYVSIMSALGFFRLADINKMMLRVFIVIFSFEINIDHLNTNVK